MIDKTGLSLAHLYTNKMDHGGPQHQYTIGMLANHSCNLQIELLKQAVFVILFPVRDLAMCTKFQIMLFICRILPTTSTCLHFHTVCHCCSSAVPLQFGNQLRPSLGPSWKLLDSYLNLAFVHIVPGKFLKLA